MYLNIGASNTDSFYRKPGWINLDLFKFKGVNVLGSGLALPFKDNSIQKIHCVHVLEHVTRDKYFPMLQEMYRVLVPGGLAYVEVPDLRGVVEKLYNAMKQNNRRDIHKWTTSIYGKNERPGMAHHWGFTEDLLTEEMLTVGFLSAVRESSAMISQHFKQEPVILMVGRK